MKEKERQKKQEGGRKRRGISTVVGTLLFLVLMFGTFGTIITTMELQSDLIETTRDVAGQEISRINENFDLSATVDGSNNLSAFVANTGRDTIEIVDLWVVNTGASPYTATRYSVDIEDAYVSGDSTVDVADSQTINLAAGTYEIKTVSSLGTMETTSVTVGGGGSSNLVVKMFTDPPNIASGEDVTLVMHVYNRGTTDLNDVAPGTVTVTPSTAVASSQITSPSTISTLKGGESALFTWHYTLRGSVGMSVSFSATATGTDDVSGSTVTGNTEVETIEFTQSFNNPRVSDTLAGKAELYVSFPSPMGDAGSNEYGYWAAVIVNPTSTTMTVNQVSFQYLTGESGLIAGVSGVSPSTGSWTYDTDNKLSVYWKYTTGETISAYSAKEWIVKVDSSSLHDSTITALAVNAFTSFGQFGKTVNTFATSSEDVAIPNVYQSSSSAGSDRMYFIDSVQDATSRNYYITVENSNGGSASGSQEKIDAGSDVIINIPPGFTSVSVTPPSGMTLVSSTTLDDGSTHIKVNVDTAIGVNSKKTITVTATAPTVSQETMYLFYLYVTGTTIDKGGSTKIIGPVGETVVRVVP